MEVARDLGYTSPDRLYEADRATCEKIVARRREEFRAARVYRLCSSAEIQRALEDSLAEARPIPISQVARLLGYSYCTPLISRFPELCRAIVAKIAAWKKELCRAIRRRLKAAAREKPPPPLRALAREFELPTADLLRDLEPELCRQIVARRFACIKEERGVLACQLEKVLLEDPPPSASAIHKRFGITRSVAMKWYHKTFRAIARRHALYRRQVKQMWLNACRNEIREIVNRLHGDGVYPSDGQVLKLLSPRFTRTDRVWVNNEISEARKGIGRPHK